MSAPELPEKPPNIDRIVAAVADVPENLNKAELLADLEGTVSLYRHGFALRHERAKRRDDMKKAINLARRLKSNPYVRARHDLCVELDRLITFTAADKRLWRFLGVRKKVSAFDNLIGFMLLSTFRDHFKINQVHQRQLRRTEPDNGAIYRLRRNCSSRI